MQNSPTEIKEKLLKALDSDYNVLDMAAVVEIISILERTSISREALETTRLGKIVNELRRKTKEDVLAKRAKDVLRRWRDMIAQEQMPPQAQAHHHHYQHQTNGAGFASQLNSSILDKRHISIVERRLSPGLPVTSPAQSISSVDLDRRSPAVPHPPTTSDQVSHASLKRHFQDVSTPRVNNTQEPHSDPVPRTHASNKRLRKDPERLNGQARPHEENSRDSFGSGSVEIISVNQVPIETNVISEPRKRGRKKLKKNAADVSQDEVKEKIASIARIPKVKTTQELLAGLQAQKEEKPSLVGNCLPLHNMDELEISRTKTEHIARFLRESKTEPAPVVAEPEPTTSTSNLSVDASIDAILARLPPIDHTVFDNLEEDDYPSNFKREGPIEVTEEQVTSLLTDQIEGLNGTRHEGLLSDENDTGFREWHEMVSKKTCEGGLIHILPYVVID